MPDHESVIRKSNLAHSFGVSSARIAIALISWTFPRIGFLKLSELFALLAMPSLFTPSNTLRRIIHCYWPFVGATVLSVCAAVPVIGHGSDVLTSDKGLYSNPEWIPLVTVMHVIVYLLCVTAVTQFFLVSSKRKISEALRWAYYATICPGLLQIFRVYTGVHFSLPFERSGLGPFSGVYDAGTYMRVMGFEFEPLAYATSLIIVCCLSMHNGRRIPWLGLIVLWQTYGAGAILGGLIALPLASSKRVTRAIIPLYACGFAALCWFVTANIHALIALFSVSLSVTERINALYACVTMWLDHPMGIGLGLYGYLFNHYDVSGQFVAAHLDWYPNNDPAMFLAYGGPIFLAAYLYIFHFAFRCSRSYWILVAAIAILFQSISSYLLFNPASILVFSMLLSQSEPLTREEYASTGALLGGPYRLWPLGMRLRIPGARWLRNPKWMSTDHI